MEKIRFGFLYVVTGRSYIYEVLESVESLKTIAPIALITDFLFDEIDYSVFSHVQIMLRNGDPGLLYKVRGIATQEIFESFVFLDSDTRFFGCLDWMEKLGRYGDFAAALEFGRGKMRKAGEKRELTNLCEYNTGVLYVSGSKLSSSTLRLWLKIYSSRQNCDFHDQFSFLMSVLELRASVLVLGSEWNFRANQVSIIDGELKVLHARVKNWRRVKRRLSASSSSIGVWVPRFNYFISGAKIHWLVRQLGRVKYVFNCRR